MKNFLHNLPLYKQMAPKSGQALDDVAAEAIANDHELFDKAAALVIPIKQTIKIEPAA